MMRIPAAATLSRVQPFTLKAGPTASNSKWTVESQLAYERLARTRKGNRNNASRCFSSAPRILRKPANSAPSAPVPEDLLLKYAESPPSYVQIRDMVKYGKTPLSDEALIASAEAVRGELPHRLARRVLAHRSLPFIVGRNPYIAEIYQLYKTSFTTLSNFPPIQNLQDNERFTNILDELVADHANNVPVLARGFSECKPYLSEEEIGSFFDRAIRNRIGIRLTAEQHLSLTYDSSAAVQEKRRKKPVDSSYIGIVDTRCSLAKIVKNCGYLVENLCEGAYGKAPDLVINGNKEAMFSYIPTHIEYVLTELLKNAFRATCEAHPDVSFANLPPVTATISQAPSSPVITIRIRDAGAGIPPQVMPKVLSYAFTTVSPDQEGEEGNPDVSSDEAGLYAIQNAGGGIGADPTLQGMQSTAGHLAGLGFGLPLSKLHCEYFGGTLELVSMYGHGTDAFVVLKGIEAA